jgi:hypothetical protein
MGDQLTEVGMIFDPDHLACQVHEPHRRPRDRAWIGRPTSRILPHVEDIHHSQGFAFGRAALAQIDAVLREEIDELPDDFGRTLKGWIGQATTSKA